LKKILFVDDDEEILFCYRMVIESENILVYTANNVNSALELVRETRIDVAVLDYMLPELRGDELAIRIHQIDPKVKIFFISGYDIALEAVKGLNVAVYGVFMKPVDPTILRKIANTEDYSSSNYQKMSVDLGNLYSNICVA
jgi:two-component system, response regulator YesN